MEAVFNDARKKEQKHRSLRTAEVNVLDSQSEALSEEFTMKRDEMRDMLCELMNDAHFTTYGAATHFDMDTLMDVLHIGFEQTRMALQSLPDEIGDVLRGMNIKKQLDALTKENDVRDLRMTELTEQLGRKSAVLDSLEKAVEKMQELEELQTADNRDAAREIDELETIVDRERTKVEALEELVRAQDRKLAALAQNAQDLMTLHVEHADEEDRDQAGYASVLDYDEDSNKSKPRVVSGQHAPVSQTVNDETKDNMNELLSFFIQELLLGKELFNEGMYEEGVEHLSNAFVVRHAAHIPKELLQNLQQILPPEQYELLLRTLPEAKQRIASMLKEFYPKLLPIFEATYEANAAGEGGVHAAVDGEKETKGMKPKEPAGKNHPKKISPPVCGLTVSLLASNGYFLCGNYGKGPATVTGVGANETSARFVVENARNGKVALKSYGKYLCIMEDGSAVTCGRRRNKWSHFDWIKHDSGEVSLRGANGKYISSANGRLFVTCDRDEAGPEERFTVV